MDHYSGDLLLQGEAGQSSFSITSRLSVKALFCTVFTVLATNFSLELFLAEAQKMIINDSWGF